MQIPTEILEYLQKQWKWDEDLKNDIIVEILELPDDAAINKSWCVARYESRRINQSLKTENRKRLEYDNHSILKEHWLGAAAAAATDPLDHLIMDEELTKRLDKLSPLLRTTLENVVVKGMTPDVVAEAQGTSANVIYKRVHDAKLILEGKL